MKQRYKYYMLFISAIIIFTCIVLFLVYSQKEFVLLFMKESLKKYLAFINVEKLLQLITYDIFYFTIILLIFLILFILKMKNKTSMKQFSYLLIALTVFDLFFFSKEFLSVKKPQEIYNMPVALSIFQSDATHFRTFDPHGIAYVLLARNRIESLAGMDPTYLSDYQNFLWLSGKHLEAKYEPFLLFYTIENTTILKLLNTKYIIEDHKLDSNEFQIISSSFYPPIKKEIYLYELKNPFPRAYIVPGAKVVSDRNKILSLLQKSQHDFTQEVLLEKNPTIPLKNSTAFQEAKVTIYEPNKIYIKVVTKSPVFLVLSENWYPGWKAYDNEKEIPIYRANYIFRSVALPAGNHTVSFVYKPNSYKIGAFITLATGTLLCGAVLLYFLDNKKFNALFSFIHINK